MSRSNSGFELQVLWNRLLALVEEQAQVLIRTAFSPLVRSCGDVSVGVFDLRGRMLAQAVTGTPGHVNTMAESVSHFLARFPVASMRDGDAFITNDPWLGTGHLNDFVVLTPAFHDGRCVALFACTSHLMDIGGLGAGTEAADVHAEGLYIPLMKLMHQGLINQSLMDIIEANSRLPIDTVGDTYSLAACNDAGKQRLSETLVEFALRDLEGLADHIVARSRSAVLEAIAGLPKGVWRNEMTLDGYDEPLTLQATLTIADDGIDVDFSGSPDEVAKGINVPLTYAAAYTTYAIICAVAPDVPNNAGGLSAIRVRAPQGSILNAQKPAAVGARHVVGQMLPDLILGCLAQVLPERTPAEGASCMWTVAVRGAYAQGPRQGERFALALTTSGGMGARYAKDGLSATAFPSGIHCMSVEVAETQAPVIFWRKELRPDSGGAGLRRGGLGQVIEFEGIDGADLRMNASFERIHNPARGRNGGLTGAPGYVGFAAGEALPGKGSLGIPTAARVVVHTPGGAGFGPPHERGADLLRQDLREGRVSAEGAALYRPAV